MIYTKSKPKWWMGKAGGKLWVVMPLNVIVRFFYWMRNG